MCGNRLPGFAPRQEWAEHSKTYHYLCKTPPLARGRSYAAGATGMALPSRSVPRRPGHGDRPAVGAAGAFDRRRPEDEDVGELVLAVGDQPREVEVLVVVDAVLGNQLAKHRDDE